MNPSPLPQHFSDQELLTLPDSPADWLWHGFIARGNLTLLTSLWKAGKTTLLTLLLTRRKSGGELAGLPVAAGKTIVLSEEPRDFWTERVRRHDFGGNLCVVPRPFNHVPTPQEWHGLLRHVAELRGQSGADLLVIDTLAHFLRGENHGVSMLDALMPLAELTSQGMGVLFLHHPRKHSQALGQFARGHGALLAHMDISIEMRHAGHDPDSRARRLFAQSRHAATPRHVLMELSAAGDAYVRLPDADDEGFQQHWDVLRMVLEDAAHELTRRDILDEWPADFAKPDSSTLWRWLKRAVASGLVLLAGTGRKTDPFRYWLPGAPERWREENPLYDLYKQQEQDMKSSIAAMKKVPFGTVERATVEREWQRLVKRPRGPEVE